MACGRLSLALPRSPDSDARFRGDKLRREVSEKYFRLALHEVPQIACVGFDRPRQSCIRSRREDLIRQVQQLEAEYDGKTIPRAGKLGRLPVKAVRGNPSSGRADFEPPSRAGFGSTETNPKIGWSRCRSGLT